MDIKRLTIGPVIRGAKRVIIESPSQERAQRLITEKLSTNHENPTRIRLKKLPKFLQGFVNPQTRVSQILRKFM